LTGSATKEYIDSMAEQKKKKLKKKAHKKQATKLILSTDEEIDEEEDLDEDEEDAGGIYLEKEDVLVIYHALKNYKPESDDEKMTHEMLVEQFEEILIVDYKVKLKRSGWS
jgi:hypothetical protein